MNEASPRGPIARVIVGIWDAMNFTRRLVFNLVFFGLLLLFLYVFFAGGGLQPLSDRTTLVVAPEGRLVEQYTSDIASRAFSRATGDRNNEEVQLRDLLRALDSARTDKRIERVYVRFDRLQASGYASLREVAAALARIRASG
jgi:protease-4